MSKDDKLKKIQQSFDLLGNPLRLQIFLKIAKEGCDCDIDSQKGYAGNCVTGIMKDLNLPQSTVSSYLKDLENWDLIECQKNGKYLYCKPKKNTLLLLKSFIDSLIGGEKLWKIQEQVQAHAVAKRIFFYLTRAGRKILMKLGLEIVV